MSTTRRVSLGGCRTRGWDLPASCRHCRRAAPRRQGRAPSGAGPDNVMRKAPGTRSVDVRIMRALVPTSSSRLQAPVVTPLTSPAPFSTPGRLHFASRMVSRIVPLRPRSSCGSPSVVGAGRAGLVSLASPLPSPGSDHYWSAVRVFINAECSGHKTASCRQPRWMWHPHGSTEPGTGSNGQNVAWDKVMPQDSRGGRSV